MTTGNKKDCSNLTDAILANYLSGSFASPLLYDTIEVCDSLQPVLEFKDAIEQLLEHDLDAAAFELIRSWFSIVYGDTPYLIEHIHPDSKLASLFVSEFVLDLDDILEEDFCDEIDEESDDTRFGGRSE